MHHVKSCSQRWRKDGEKRGKPARQEVVKNNSLEKETSSRRELLIPATTRSNVGHRALVPIGREELRGKDLPAETWIKALSSKEKIDKTE